MPAFNVCATVGYLKKYSVEYLAPVIYDLLTIGNKCHDSPMRGPDRTAAGARCFSGSVCVLQIMPARLGDPESTYGREAMPINIPGLTISMELKAVLIAAVNGANSA